MFDKFNNHNFIVTAEKKSKNNGKQMLNTSATSIVFINYIAVFFLELPGKNGGWEKGKGEEKKKGKDRFFTIKNYYFSLNC